MSSKIESYAKYPEFGHALGNPYSLTEKQQKQRLTAFSLANLAVAGIGMVWGAPAALGTGGIGALAIVIYQVAKTIFYAYKSHQYRLAFDSKENNPAAPKLGEYAKNDLIISNHASESFKWKKELIKSAEHSIELSGNFAGGKDFREVLDLIEERMEQHADLKCHLLISPDLLEPEDMEKLKGLEKYPNFHYLITKRVYTVVPDFISEENHVKLLVVDGKYFAMGGTGIHEKMSREESPASTAPESFGAKFIDKGFRDTDIIGMGESAQTMRNQFYNLYRIWEYRMTGKHEDRFFDTNKEKGGSCASFDHSKERIEGVSLKYVVSGPEHRQQNPISREIADLTAQAQTEVRIANLLFNPDPIVSEALLQAKKRNISVIAYLNGTSLNSIAHYLYALPNRYNYKLLSEAYEYQAKDQLYHKKVMTVDSKYTVVGSYNLGVKSALGDYESVCVIDNESVAKIMNAALDVDQIRSKKLTGEALRNKRKWWKIPSKYMIGILGSFFG